MKPMQSNLRRTSVAFLILCCFLAFPARGQAVRDWKRFPAIAESAAPRDLYALGDVHGDYDRMVELLAGAHLIAPNPATPQAVQWTGGTDVLVCTGDMIDKFNHGMSVIALLRTLQPLAANSGGQVIVTMGNHEADFLADAGGGNKATEFDTELEAAGIAPGDVAAGKDAAGIGGWLRDLPIAAKVGDWFFCHAGNTGGLSLTQLEQQIEAQVNQHGFDCPILQDENSLIQARMHPRPWWDWDGRPPELKDESKGDSQKPGGNAGEVRLRAAIAVLGAHHLVFGHQPGKIKFSDGTQREAGEMYQKYDGLVFLIDTGMSRGVSSGRGALLHITEGSVHGASAVYADDTTRTLVQ
jgi:hypothetical protein